MAVTALATGVGIGALLPRSQPQLTVFASGSQAATDLFDGLRVFSDEGGGTIIGDTRRLKDVNGAPAYGALGVTVFPDHSEVAVVCFAIDVASVDARCVPTTDFMRSGIALESGEVGRYTWSQSAPPSLEPNSLQ